MPPNVKWLTATRSLIVHLVYDDGYTVCGYQLDLADVDEGGYACRRCQHVAHANTIAIPERTS